MHGERGGGLAQGGGHVGKDRHLGVPMTKMGGKRSDASVARLSR